MTSVAVSYRFHLHDGIRKSLRNFDALEVIVDQYFAASSAERLELEELSSHIPIVVHGLRMSLGSPGVPDQRYIDQVARALCRLNAVCFSEHIAFVDAGGVHSGGLLPLEFTEEALETIVRNVEFMRRSIPVPIMLENITRLFEPAEPAMEESVFIERLCHSTGAKLLFDLENAYSNEINLGSSMAGLVHELRPGLVGALHLAGGYFKGGLYIDDHGHDIPEKVLECLGGVVAKHRPEYVIIERDRNCNDVVLLLEEVTRVRAALSNAS